MKLFIIIIISLLTFGCLNNEQKNEYVPEWLVKWIQVYNIPTE